MFEKHIPKSTGSINKHAESMRRDTPGDMSRRHFLIASGMNAASLVAGTTLAGELAHDEYKAHEGEFKFGSLKIEYASETDVLSGPIEHPGWWREKTLVLPQKLVGRSINPHSYEWRHMLKPADALNRRAVEQIVHLPHGQLRTETRIEPIADPKHLPREMPPSLFMRISSTRMKRRSHA